MKNFALAAMAFFIAISISACKKDETSLGECTDGSANYPWLAAGHELCYVFSGFTGDDSLYIKVVSQVSGGTYQVVSKLLFYDDSTTEYYSACNNDLYTSGTGDFSEYGHYWFSLDANVGDTWTRSKNGTIYTYHLYGKNETAEGTLAGQTFTGCYKFSFHSSTNFATDTVYFKSDVGIVFYHGFSGSFELVRKNF